jgi:hypothetical protein
LTTAGADYGRPGAHAAAAAAVTTAIVMGMMRCGIAASTSAAGILLCLATGLAAPWSGVTALLVELLFARSEDKLLTAVATGQ